MKLTGDIKEFEDFLERNEELGLEVNGQPFIHKEELRKILKDEGITGVYEINYDTYLGLGNDKKIRIEAM